MSLNSLAPSNRILFSCPLGTDGGQDSVFLDLAYDVRSVILEMLLQYTGQFCCDETIEYQTRPIRLQTRGWRYINHPSYGKLKSAAPVSNVHILRVCRQLYFEGRAILYQRSRFQATNVPALMTSLPNAMAYPTRALIRKILIEVPYRLVPAYQQDTPEDNIVREAFLDEFLEFFAKELPGLTELTLKTGFEPESSAKKISFVYRAIIYISAWIECKHPQLKRAIWLGDSGGKRWEEWEWPSPTKEVDLSIQDPSRVDIRDLRYVELAVHILSEEKGKRYCLQSHDCIDMMAPLREQEQQDMILDCGAIRRTGWEKLLNLHPRTFALDSDSITSSESETMMEHTPDKTTYTSLTDA